MAKFDWTNCVNMHNDWTNCSCQHPEQWRQLSIVNMEGMGVLGPAPYRCDIMLGEIINLDEKQGPDYISNS